MKNNLKEIISTIIEGNDFVVTSHCSPDGDNIGSTLAIYNTLINLKKNVLYVLDDETPNNLKFLVENVEILKSSQVSSKDYILIALDCGDKSRLCCEEHIISNAKSLICIDHHASNDYYGNLNFIDAECSSTCEMVYNLLKDLEKAIDKEVITEDIATYLYTGLVTDTGNFSYSNTKSSSFLMACDLMDKNARRDLIIQNIFQSNPANYYKLLGEALNTLEIQQNKIASIMLTKDMLDRNNISFNDADGITSYTRDIEGIEVGLLFKQKGENEIKVSFRSKNYVNVSKIAQSFGGGGHVRASGCTIKDTIEKAKEMVINEVIKYI